MACAFFFESRNLPPKKLHRSFASLKDDIRKGESAQANPCAFLLAMKRQPRTKTVNPSAKPKKPFVRNVKWRGEIIEVVRSGVLVPVAKTWGGMNLFNRANVDDALRSWHPWLSKKTEQQL